MKEDIDFPKDDGGSVVFKRKWFIEETCRLVLEKSDNVYPSYYWRAPRGSGKTVFLKLMGLALQELGHDVYMFENAKDLDRYENEFFRNLAEKSNDKTVVFLIDEVHNNPGASFWTPFLKNPPRNLLILGVGIPRLNVLSPQFAIKFPNSEGKNERFPMFLTERDLDEEVNQHFIKKSQHSPAVTTAICLKMLQYTNGHLFPFVKLVEHLVTTEGISNYIDEIHYYVGRREFMESNVALQIRRRCFDEIFPAIRDLETLLCNRGRGDKGICLHLSRLGIWHNGELISPLVRHEVFYLAQIHEQASSKSTRALVDPQTVPYVEQLIRAGLENLTKADFFDPMVDTIAVENAIGFKWVLNIKSSLPDVWIVNQSRTMYKEKKVLERSRALTLYLMDAWIALLLKLLLTIALWAFKHISNGLIMLIAS